MSSGAVVAAVSILALGAARAASAGELEPVVRAQAAEVKRAAAELGAAGDPRCRPEAAQDAKLYSSQFHWGYTRPELLAAFKAAYASPKRLPRRAYWNAAARRFELPYLSERGGAVVLPESFARHVARHVADALAAGSAEGVFFPDMGHSHFLIPEDLWTSKYSSYPVDRMSRLYEAMFSEARLEVLYHTAEQLKTREADGTLVTDPETRRRYESRNVVGLNGEAGGVRMLKNPQSPANTVSDVPGYFWWGAGFNISADENGCFAVEAGGKTYRFDLSLFDLEPSPEEGPFSATVARGASPRFGECESLRRERARAQR